MQPLSSFPPSGLLECAQLIEPVMIAPVTVLVSFCAGLTNPLWSANISQSLSCVTCWFYISFYFIPSNESQLIAPACGTSPNFFCSADLVQAGKSGDPSPGFLPASFRPASGDFYDRSVVRSSLAGEKLGNLKQIRNTVTPL